jgi:hypothetical protein
MAQTPNMTNVPGRTMPAQPGWTGSPIGNEGYGQRPFSPTHNEGYRTDPNAPMIGPGAPGSQYQPSVAAFQNLQPGTAPTQGRLGDAWSPHPPEMGAAFYRHAAASAMPGAGVGPQYWIDRASQARENGIPTSPHAGPLVTDAFGNPRFDYQPTMGGRYTYGTGTGVPRTPLGPATAPRPTPSSSSQTPTPAVPFSPIRNEGYRQR